MTRQLVLVSLVLACCFDLRYAYADKGIDFFEKKIRPVLVQECYRCHSSAKRQRGGLVLDTRAGIRKGGDTGPAVVPGKPEKSLLLTALRYKGDLQMPPRGKLPDEVIADFEKWIAQGAPDPRDGKTVAKHGIDMEAGRKFWAFQPFKKSPLPEVSDVAWPFNDIDRFILARLEAGKIKPGSDADRVTLIRRAYFDLIGLPPPLEKIDAFVNDTSPKAFEKVVDELLASPHFGERWGRHWLDVARFAESTGGGRSLLLKEAWRYRDYVIESFNADKPYNRFVAEQIAGDLLPASSPNERAQNLIATAFLALGPTNYELQDKQVLEVDVIDEQLDTIGRAFLGLTIGCARCHDHKFDPIPTRDYYALAGIFKSTQTLIHDNVSRWVEQPLPLTDKEEAAWKAYLSAEAKLKARIAAAKRAKPSLKGPIAVAHLAGLVYDDISAKQVGVWKKSQYYRSYVGTGYLHDDNADKGQKTVTFVPAFKKAGRYEVRLAYTPGANRATNVPVTILHRDGETNRKVNQRHVPPIDGRFVSLGTYHFDENDQWYVLISNEGTDGYVIVDAVQFLPEGAEQEKAKPATEPLLTDDVKKLEDELKRLQKTKPSRPMAISVREAKDIGDFYICIRGVVHNRGEVVPRGFLQVASSEPVRIPTGESGRRQLADWLASAKNPLTARVMVNRIWHHLFGTGIVRSVDNFGRTGERPSHPELLDYLATRFVEEGWSIKKMIRMMMLSRTYQLSSRANPKAAAADPENRLLARMNRRRLEAEAIHDAILYVSGQLDLTMGGPTIKKGTAIEYGYRFDGTRRAVYTPVFRNTLPELFAAFDFADPNLVTGRRSVSTVAPQALFLMNNPFVIEQAQHFASRILAKNNLTDAQRVELAYRMALGRLPSENERRLAMAFLTRKSANPVDEWTSFCQTLFACIDFRYVN